MFFQFEEIILNEDGTFVRVTNSEKEFGNWVLLQNGDYKLTQEGKPSRIIQVK